MTRHLLALAFLIAVRAVPAAALSEVICTGDCNYDGTVAIDELMTGVNIALDRMPVADCAGFNLRADGAVTIDELLGGVHNALYGCPSARFRAGRV